MKWFEWSSTILVAWRGSAEGLAVRHSSLTCSGSHVPVDCMSSECLLEDPVWCVAWDDNCVE